MIETNLNPLYCTPLYYIPWRLQMYIGLVLETSKTCYKEDEKHFFRDWLENNVKIVWHTFVSSLTLHQDRNLDEKCFEDFPFIIKSTLLSLSVKVGQQKATIAICRKRKMWQYSDTFMWILLFKMLYVKYTSCIPIVIIFCFFLSRCFFTDTFIVYRPSTYATVFLLWWVLYLPTSMRIMHILRRLPLFQPRIVLQLLILGYFEKKTH